MHPFDLRQMMMEKHAQPVVLIHFSIALFIAGVGVVFVAQWTKRPALGFAAYVNLLLAALMVVPAVATGLVAWQWALEGHRIKGILLLHMVFALAAAATIWIVWWIHFRARRGGGMKLPNYRWVLGFGGGAFWAIAGHLGGFLTGVNM